MSNFKQPLWVMKSHGCEIARFKKESRWGSYDGLVSLNRLFTETYRDGLAEMLYRPLWTGGNYTLRVDNGTGEQTSES